MKKLSSYKKLIKILPVFAAVVFSGAALLVMPEQVTQGAKSGLSVCSGVLIPSLFPFLVLSGFVSSPVISEPLSKLLNPFTRLLFALPGECGCVILMSVLGGFPVGARMSDSLYRSGQISQKDAHRLLSFCVNAGPAFVVTAVGTVMLGSKEAGLILFTALTLSSTLIGAVQGLFSDRSALLKQPVKNYSEKESAASAFTSSVSDAAAAMLSICAWMILFSCIISVLMHKAESPSFIRLISLFAEVTTGSANAAKTGNISLTAAAIGFSGFCVHCQLLPFLQSAGMSYVKFLGWRVLSGALSFAISTLLLLFFPCDIAVSVSPDIRMYEAFSVSVPAAAALLFMCAVFICSFPPDRKIRRGRRFVFR